MAYYDLSVTVDKDHLNAVAEYAVSMNTSGLFIEDLSNVVDVLEYSADYDYIDESLLNKDRSKSVIHLYPAGKDDATETAELLRRFCAENEVLAEVFIEEKEDENWETSWQQGYEHVTAGKYEVLPYWEESSNSGLITVRIDTAEAYGSGQSVNTQLCLEALSDLDVSGMKVLDMGTGTGILGIAALLSGAENVIGMDTDPFSIENSLENAERNGVRNRFKAKMRTPVTVGRLAYDYDAVFAHITADVILKDAGLYYNVLRKSGIFLGGGIISDRKEEVITELERIGFGYFTCFEREEWVTLVCRKV